MHRALSIAGAHQRFTTGAQAGAGRNLRLEFEVELVVADLLDAAQLGGLARQIFV